MKGGRKKRRWEEVRCYKVSWKWKIKEGEFSEVRRKPKEEAKRGSQKRRAKAEITQKRYREEGLVSSKRRRENLQGSPSLRKIKKTGEVCSFLINILRIGFDPHAFVHLREERKRRHNQIYWASHGWEVWTDDNTCGASSFYHAYMASLWGILRKLH